MSWNINFEKFDKTEYRGNQLGTSKYNYNIHKSDIDLISIRSKPNKKKKKKYIEPVNKHDMVYIP